MKQITIDTISKKEPSLKIIKQVLTAIRNISWGSVEIFIQNSQIVQITERKITKPQLSDNSEVKKNGRQQLPS